jgi:hypothetical protein
MILTILWDVVPCSRVEVDLQRHYTALHPRRLNLKEITVRMQQSLKHRTRPCILLLFFRTKVL